MACKQQDIIKRKKKVKTTEREYNTALYLLRCYELNIRDTELDAMTIGMVYDIFTEKQNDNAEYREVATQEDFDKF